MKVSIFNICSEALDMLKFSTKMAFENAGNEFDYVLVLWNPSKEVEDWAKNGFMKKNFHIFYYNTDTKLRFIENLRNCFNLGFDEGFNLNEYACGINTDMAFGKFWLSHLTRYADPNSIINCRQIEPFYSPFHESPHDFGPTTENEFRLEDWCIFCSSIWQDRLLHESEWGKRADATPYLIHKSLWEKVGHWEVQSDRFGRAPSDIEWFNKAKYMGFKNMKSLGSIVYHAGGLETKRRREK